MSCKEFRWIFDFPYFTERIPVSRTCQVGACLDVVLDRADEGWLDIKLVSLVVGQKLSQAALAQLSFDIIVIQVRQLKGLDRLEQAVTNIVFGAPTRCEQMSLL